MQSNQEKWEGRAKYWDDKLPNLAAALRDKDLQEYCDNLENKPPEIEPKEQVSNWKEEVSKKFDFVINMWKDPSNDMDGLHTLATLKDDILEIVAGQKIEVSNTDWEIAIAFGEFLNKHEYDSDGAGNWVGLDFPFTTKEAFEYFLSEQQKENQDIDKHLKRVKSIQEGLKTIYKSEHLLKAFMVELERYDNVDTAIWYTLRDSQTDKALRESEPKEEVSKWQEELTFYYGQNHMTSDELLDKIDKDFVQPLEQQIIEARQELLGKLRLFTNPYFIPAQYKEIFEKRIKELENLLAEAEQK